MPATKSTDLLFEPKVWSDHIQAYFDRKLVYGAFAVRNDELKAEGTGLTVNFPFYKAIGDAQEPTEDESLVVDRLEDDSFLATVFEVGKAVGIKKRAFKKTGDSMDGMMSEAQRQIARVHAEKVDAKLNTEITTGANYATGFLATAAADTATVKRLLEAKIKGFGDRHDESVVCFMHSLQYLDLMSDAGTGFLKADANDPFKGIKGFAGRSPALLGMAVVVVDTVPLNPGGQIDTTDNYLGTIHKVNSYGIMNKQEMEMDEDKDILAREWLVTGNQWYAVKSFHAEVAADDLRACSFHTTIS